MAEVVGAFLVRDGRLLMGLRAPHRRFYPNVWDCVGGHVEAGESHDETLVRELGEEIGVTPTAFSILTELPVDETATCLFYRVEAWTGGEPTLTNDEHTELRWFTPAEAEALPNLAMEEYRPLFRVLVQP